MPSTTSFVRLEPRARSAALSAGLAARIYDPAWLLARQWQFGEFMGENSGTPISARLRAERSTLTRYFPDRSAITPQRAVAYDGVKVPLEVVVEREAVHARTSWTPKLRAEAGLEFLRRLRGAGVDRYKPAYLKLYPITRPTIDDRITMDSETIRFLDIMAQRVPDGARLHADLSAALGGPALLPVVLPMSFGVAAGLPPAPPVQPGDAANVTRAVRGWLEWCATLFSEPNGNPLPWIPERLEYQFAVAAPTSDGEMVLEAAEYLGGSLDWHSFAERRGTALAPDPGAVAPEAIVRTILPTPLRFKGMPNSRWWEFEDGAVDFGKIDASPADLARLLLLEFVLVYGNDFFVIPIDLPVGSLCLTRSLVVTDTFGVRVRIMPTAQTNDTWGSAWTMFSLSAHERTPAASPADPPNVFFLPPVIGQRLSSPPIEEVLLLRDEMANMAWAVERRIESGAGHSLDRFEAYQQKRRQAQAAASESPGAAPRSEGAPLRYRLASTVPDYWFPLVPVKADGNAVRLKRGVMAVESGKPLEPRGRLLDLGGALLYEEEVPREGARVTRDYEYTRWVDGSTHLWIGRRKETGRGEGSSGLRYDFVDS